MAEHKDLADPNIHEPKGMSSLTGGASDADKVYLSDGAGTGSWTKLNAAGAVEYGGIYSQESDAVALSTIGTTRKVFAGFSADAPANVVTPDFSSNTLTVSTAGDYKVCFYASISTVAAGDAGQYKFIVNVNGTATRLEVMHDFSGASDLASLSVGGVLTLAASDVVTVYVESDEAGDTDDINVLNASLDVTLLDAS